MADPVSPRSDETKKFSGRRGAHQHTRGEGFYRRGIDSPRRTGNYSRASQWRGAGGGRGPGRGRGGGERGRGNPDRANRNNYSTGSFSLTEEPDAGPRGALLHQVDRSKIQSMTMADGVDMSITECDNVASYSWLNKSSPTILVPGTPPVWTPPRIPRKLKQDSGEYFRDQNAARWSRYPMEPAVRAIYAQNEDFAAADMDIVCCGNTMGNLIEFLDSGERRFQFKIEVIGNTAFLVRGGAPPLALIPDVRGYGHTFPEAYTSWTKGSEGSESHQRLVKYKFGNLWCLLRSESDGFMKDILSASDLSDLENATLKEPSQSDLTSLESDVGQLQVSQTNSTNSKNLVVKLGGQTVPQKAIFDLKTRSFRTELNPEEMYPRLWASQTSNLIVAYHKHGQFDDIKQLHLAQELKDWEASKLKLLQRLHNTLVLLRDMAKKAKDQKVEVCCYRSGQLQIRRLSKSTWSCLPASLRAKWAGEESEDDSTDSEEAEDYLKF